MFQLPVVFVVAMAFLVPSQANDTQSQYEASASDAVETNSLVQIVVNAAGELDHNPRGEHAESLDRAVRSETADARRENATVSYPPVLMHYMPWFSWSRRWGWAGYHWKEQKDWATLFSKRRVASHFTPTSGPYNSWDRDVICYHLELMQLAGIKGIIVNWYGTRQKNDFADNLRASDAIIDEASKKGMLFTVCYEDWTVVDGAKWGEEPTGEELVKARRRMRDDLKYIRDKYATKKGFLREASSGTTGRPVMLIFGPRNVKEPSEWSAALAEVFASEPERPRLVTLYRPGVTGPGVGDGTFSWFPPMQKQTKRREALKSVHDYLRDFYDEKNGTLHIGSVFPGFKDYYKQGRGTESYGRLPEYNGHTMEAALYQARAHQPTFLQVATWNDWEEGTIIEPAEGRPTPYFYLLKLQKHITGRSYEPDFEAAFEKFKALKVQQSDFGWS